MTEPIRSSLRLGRGTIDVTLPRDTTVLTGRAMRALADAPTEVAAALREPIGCDPLRTIVQRRRPGTVAITISDITRPVPNELLLTALLAELNAAGVRDEQVVIIIATGMHRPSTAQERDIMLGKALQRRCEVIDHCADDATSVTRICDDPPVSVNTRFLQSDLRIVTGLIEPHFMAGYSGGRKGVCPGLVDLNTVQRFHGYRVMGDPRSVEGMLEGNPCHELSVKIADIVGVDFLLNVAITHDRHLSGVYAGDLHAAFLAGVRDVADWAGAAIDEPFDLVVTCAGGFPLEQNVYQSVKGMVTALPALHEQSTLLIASACTEIGSPEYTAMMMRWQCDWRGFLHHIGAAEQTEKDQWQYQMQTRVLERIGVERLRLVNDGLSLDTQRKLAVTPVEGDGDAAARLQRFVDDYVRRHPQARVAIIPEGPYTMLTAALQPT